MPFLGNEDRVGVGAAPAGSAVEEQARPFEPIAIIGMGCRWPGELTEPSDLWDFLQAKRDAYSDIPEDRINTAAFYHEKRDRPGSFYSRGGCFLKSPKDFDHTFFGINPQEAANMDPAQRKLLETVYEAFESSGTTLEHISGSKTGSFVGNFNYDHQLMQYRDAEYPEAYAVSGGGLSILSNRINYVFNLKGPSMTLDTACSSSMYALHMACSAIHAGDCSSAIVAGSNLILTPECQIFSSALGAVSPTSRCHTFDAAADGYARADGVGALYVKRLQDAIADRDPIRALIRSTAVNANGKTGGITRPSSSGQESVIRQAYERACLDVSSTSYFECHGTGTAVGDPLEVAAIGRVFADSRSLDDPLLIGSVKTNLGHSEPVSGIAGMMKVILALEHDVVPPTIGVVTVNPEVDLKNGLLSIVTESTPWPRRDLRIASVNSFGYGGANAHVIIESTKSFFANEYIMRDFGIARFSPNMIKAMDKDARCDSGTSLVSYKVAKSAAQKLTKESSMQDQYLLTFSAHDARTLKSNIEAIGGVAEKYSIRDLAFTLSAGRSKLSDRSFVVANRETLKEAMIASNLPSHKVTKGEKPRLAFIMTGQGAQWNQMGLGLIENFPVCRASLAALDKVLRGLYSPPEWTLEGKLRNSDRAVDINKACISQPLTTAIQIILIELLRSWNISPAVCMGHSSGEIAAAYGSGCITSREAIILAYLRGKVVKQNKSQGMMLAVGLGVQQLELSIGRELEAVTVACYNSPNSVTLSGDEKEIMAIKGVLDRKKRFARLLDTDGNAYHSSHMRDLGAEYEREIRHNCLGLPEYQPDFAEIPFISSVTGERISKQALSPSYWRSNLELPVRFQQALTQLLNTLPVDALVEIGPHSTLRSPITETYRLISSQENREYIPTMVRNEHSVISLLRTAGALWLKDYPLDLLQINAPRINKDDKMAPKNEEAGNMIPDLPRYQWQYEKTVLLENRWTRDWRLRKHPRHDILGSLIPGNTTSCSTWRNLLRTKDVSWLSDHCIDGRVVFPAAGYVAMAVEAATQRVETTIGHASVIECYELEDITFKQALLIPQDNRGVETFLTLTPCPVEETASEYLRFDFVATSVSNMHGVDQSVDHALGRLNVVYGTRAVKQATQAPKEMGIKRGAPSSRWYQKFASVGMSYGPCFRRLHDVNVFDDVAVAQLDLKSSLSGESRYAIHPTTIDPALQLGIIASHSGRKEAMKSPYLPFSIRQMLLWPIGDNVTLDKAISVARGNGYGTRGVRSDVTVTIQNRVSLQATDVLFLSSDQTNAASDDNAPFSRLTWIPDFDFLNTEIVTRLHPLVNLGVTPLSTHLDSLALHQLVQFHETHLEYFRLGSKVSHLQRFLDWTKERIALAHQHIYPNSERIIHMSSEERASEIERLSGNLIAISNEARLSCHMYDNLPAILSGEKTGIQVALEDDRLSAMYRDAHRVSEGNRRLAAIVALAAQKNPDQEILEIGAGTGSATNEILNRLRGGSVDRIYKTYAFTDIAPAFLKSAEDRFCDFQGMEYFTFNMEDISAAESRMNLYDLVVASNAVHASSNILQTLRNLRKTLKTGGKLVLLELTTAPLASGLLLVSTPVILSETLAPTDYLKGTFSDFWKGEDDPSFPRHGGPFLSKQMWAEVLPQAGFSGLDFFLDDYEGQASSTVIVATAIESTIPGTSSPLETAQTFSVVVRESSLPFALGLVEYGQSTSCELDIVSLQNDEKPRSKHLLVLAEFQKPLFGNLSVEEWTRLQSLLTTANSVLWVTNGDLGAGKEPEYAMINGIATGLRTEMSKLQLSTVDFDQNTDFASSETKELLMTFAKKCSTSSSEGRDIYFRQNNGVFYLSRLVPDRDLNDKQRRAKKHVDQEGLTSFHDVINKTFDVSIGQPGILQSLHFQERGPTPQWKKSGDLIEIEVKAVGISRENVAGLLGRSQFATFGDECAGIVRKVQSNVQNVEEGDRVFCPVFGSCGNKAVVRASWCQKMNRHDTYQDAAKNAVAFCTAVRALEDLAHLTEGETILIYSALGAVGFASLQIAALCHAKVLAAVEDETSKEDLMRLYPRITADCIFLSSDRSLARSIMERTNGRGVDVVLSDVSIETLQNHWDCIAPNGRFINVRRCDELEGRKGNMRLPCRNFSYIAFDLETLSRRVPLELAKLMNRVGTLRAEGLIQSIPVQPFQAPKAEGAFETCLGRPSSSNIVITFDDTTEEVKFRKPRFQSTFDPEATYLLVGCLSDLGQAFSQWMVHQGATHFTYFSRSGSASEETREFLGTLHSQGVTMDIVRGDVSSESDVTRAVDGCKRPIKGVVQAALSLKDRLFENLTHEMFDALVGPRVRGTINLHKALDGHPLDFFLMWSSWTAMFGTATQSNYLATCSFMDAFARHRRSLGLPATSLSLSQIFDTGHLKRVPSDGASMTRNGLYGNEIYEFLQFCDAAIASSKTEMTNMLPYDPLVGAHLLAGIEPAGLRDLDATHPLDGMAWYRDPRFSHLVKAVRNLQENSSVGKARPLSTDNGATASERILKKLAQLLYISVSDIDVSRPITAYGIDSMVAAELRNWLYVSFAVDISLFDILDADTSVHKLGQMATQDH